jgi:hypothetical protein
MVRVSVVTLPPLDDNNWKYEVKITESDGSGSKTTHIITMKKNYYMNLTERGRIIPEELIKKSFEFLPDRESKESILQQFDIAMIKDYFPDYEREMKKNNKLY